MIKEKRNSSFELLRIICIVLIIAGHYYTHGDYTKENLLPLSFNSVYVQTLQLYARIACSVFVLITGYFMSNMVSYHGVYKKIISLVIEMYFYSIISIIIFLLVSHGKITINLIIQAAFPFLWGNWFVEYYILLLLCIPFLNSLIENLDKRKFNRLLLLMFICWSIITSLSHKAWQFSNLDFMFVFYLTGAYIKKYNMSWLSNTKCVCCICLNVFGLYASMAVFDYIGIKSSNYYWIEHAGYFKEFDSIFSVPIAICVFIIFSRIKFYNKKINYVARTTLGIYLFSDNFLMQDIIWRKLFPNTDYIHVAVIHSIIKIIVVFIIGFFIDVLRQKLTSLLEKNFDMINKVYICMKDCFHKVENYFVK